MRLPEKMYYFRCYYQMYVFFINKQNSYDN